MTPRQRILGAVLLGTAALVLFGGGPSGSADDLAALPTVRRPAPAPGQRPVAGTAVAATPTALADLVDRAADIEASRLRRQRSDAQQPFAVRTWAAAAGRAPAAAVATLVPAAPVAPPLPFTYLGRQVDAGQITVFLGQGEQTHLARARTVVDERWRVESITPQAVVFTYLPLNLTQQLPTGAGP